MKNTKDMSNRQLVNALNRIGELKQWIDDLENEALSRIEKGEKIDGYTSKESKTNRKWSNSKKVEEVLKSLGLKNAQIFKKTLISPVSALKLVSEQSLNDYIIKPVGKAKLARV